MNSRPINISVLYIYYIFTYKYPHRNTDTYKPYTGRECTGNIHTLDWEKYQAPHTLQSIAQDKDPDGRGPGARLDCTLNIHTIQLFILLLNTPCQERNDGILELQQIGR